MTETKGQSLELFFIDGKPDGMLTAEVFNWTGHILMTPRTQISEALKRKEARYTGTYILLGENPDGPLAYIGEGEDISYRIKNHDTAKDWWTSALLITTAGNNLNKAHVKYLESRLIEEARRIGKIPLENGTIPTRPSLSEASQANMEAFLAYIVMILPALCIDFLLANTRPQQKTVRPTQDLQEYGEPVFELLTKKHGIKATAKLENGEFVVHRDSIARLSWEGTESHNYRTLFDQLVSTGMHNISEDGKHRIFSENYAFKSPSAAGAVLNGRAPNGQEAWKTRDTGISYRQWEAEQLEKNLV